MLQAAQRIDQDRRVSGTRKRSQSFKQVQLAALASVRFQNVFATQRLSISAVTEYLNTLEELKKDSIPPGVLRHSVEGVGTILAGDFLQQYEPTFLRGWKTLIDLLELQEATGRALVLMAFEIAITGLPHTLTSNELKVRLLDLLISIESSDENMLNREIACVLLGRMLTTHCFYEDESSFNIILRALMSSLAQQLHELRLSWDYPEAKGSVVLSSTHRELLFYAVSAAFEVPFDRKKEYEKALLYACLEELEFGDRTSNSYLAVLYILNHVIAQDRENRRVVGPMFQTYISPLIEEDSDVYQEAFAFMRTWVRGDRRRVAKQVHDGALNFLKFIPKGMLSSPSRKEDKHALARTVLEEVRRTEKMELQLRKLMSLPGTSVTLRPDNLQGTFASSTRLLKYSKDIICRPPNDKIKYMVMEREVDRIVGVPEGAVTIPPVFSIRGGESVSAPLLEASESWTMSHFLEGFHRQPAPSMHEQDVTHERESFGDPGSNDIPHGFVSHDSAHLMRQQADENSSHHNAQQQQQDSFSGDVSNPAKNRREGDSSDFPISATYRLSLYYSEEEDNILLQSEVESLDRSTRSSILSDLDRRASHVRLRVSRRQEADIDLSPLVQLHSSLYYPLADPYRSLAMGNEFELMVKKDNGKGEIVTFDVIESNVEGCSYLDIITEQISDPDWGNTRPSQMQIAGYSDSGTPYYSPILELPEVAEFYTADGQPIYKIKPIKMGHFSEDNCEQASMSQDKGMRQQDLKIAGFDDDGTPLCLNDNCFVPPPSGYTQDGVPFYSIGDVLQAARTHYLMKDGTWTSISTDIMDRSKELLKTTKNEEEKLLQAVQDRRPSDNVDLAPLIPTIRRKHEKLAPQKLQIKLPTGDPSYIVPDSAGNITMEAGLTKSGSHSVVASHKQILKDSKNMLFSMRDLQLGSSSIAAESQELEAQISTKFEEGQVSTVQRLVSEVLSTESQSDISAERKLSERSFADSLPLQQESQVQNSKSEKAIMSSSMGEDTSLPHTESQREALKFIHATESTGALSHESSSASIFDTVKINRVMSSSIPLDESADSLSEEGGKTSTYVALLTEQLKQPHDIMQDIAHVNKSVNIDIQYIDSDLEFRSMSATVTKNLRFTYQHDGKMQCFFIIEPKNVFRVKPKSLILGPNEQNVAQVSITFYPLRSRERSVELHPKLLIVDEKGSDLSVFNFKAFVGPSLLFSTVEIAFGWVSPHKTKDSFLSVNNVGPQCVSVQLQVAVTSQTSEPDKKPFRVYNHDVKVPSLSTCNIPVSFAPEEYGVFEGTLFLDCGQGETHRIALSGFCGNPIQILDHQGSTVEPAVVELAHPSDGDKAMEEEEEEIEETSDVIVEKQQVHDRNSPVRPNLEEKNSAGSIEERTERKVDEETVATSLTVAETLDRAAVMLHAEPSSTSKSQSLYVSPEEKLESKTRKAVESLHANLESSLEGDHYIEFGWCPKFPRSSDSTACVHVKTLHIRNLALTKENVQLFCDSPAFSFKSSCALEPQQLGEILIELDTRRIDSEITGEYTSSLRVVQGNGEALLVRLHAYVGTGLRFDVQAAYIFPPCAIGTSQEVTFLLINESQFEIACTLARETESGSSGVDSFEIQLPKHDEPPVVLPPLSTREVAVHFQCRYHYPVKRELALQIVRPSLVEMNGNGEHSIFLHGISMAAAMKIVSAELSAEAPGQIVQHSADTEEADKLSNEQVHVLQRWMEAAQENNHINLQKIQALFDIGEASSKNSENAEDPKQEIEVSEDALGLVVAKFDKGSVDFPCFDEESGISKYAAPVSIQNLTDASLKGALVVSAGFTIPGISKQVPSAIEIPGSSQKSLVVEHQLDSEWKSSVIRGFLTFLPSSGGLSTNSASATIKLVSRQKATIVCNPPRIAFVGSGLHERQTQYILIRNLTESLILVQTSVSSQNSVFTTEAASFSLGRYEQYRLLVNFVATEHGSFSEEMTLVVTNSGAETSQSLDKVVVQLFAKCEETIVVGFPSSVEFGNVVVEETENRSFMLTNKSSYTVQIRVSAEGGFLAEPSSFSLQAAQSTPIVFGCTGEMAGDQFSSYVVHCNEVTLAIPCSARVIGMDLETNFKFNRIFFSKVPTGYCTWMRLAIVNKGVTPIFLSEVVSGHAKLLSLKFVQNIPTANPKSSSEHIISRDLWGLMRKNITYLAEAASWSNFSTTNNQSLQNVVAPSAIQGQIVRIQQKGTGTLVPIETLPELPPSHSMIFMLGFSSSYQVTLHTGCQFRFVTASMMESGAFSLLPTLKCSLLGCTVRMVAVYPFLSDFGVVAVDPENTEDSSSASKSAYLVNHSCKPQEVSLVTVVGPFATDFHGTQTLSPGEKRHLRIQFFAQKPRTLYTGEIVFAHPFGQVSIKVRGHGACADITSLRGDTIDFKMVRQGQEKREILRLQNSGLIQSTATIAMNSRCFSLLPNEGKIVPLPLSSTLETQVFIWNEDKTNGRCSISIPAQSVAELPILYAKGTATEDSTFMELGWRATEASSLRALAIRLVGRTGVPQLKFSSTSIHFGFCIVGREYQREITISNPGQVDCQWSSAKNLGETGRLLRMEPADGVVEPGQAQVIQCCFTPKDTTPLFSIFSVTSEAGGFDLMCQADVGVPFLRVEPEKRSFELGTILVKTAHTLSIKVYNTSFHSAAECSITKFSDPSLLQAKSSLQAVFHIEPCNFRLEAQSDREITLKVFPIDLNLMVDFSFCLESSQGESYPFSVTFVGGAPNLAWRRKPKQDTDADTDTTFDSLDVLDLGMKMKNEPFPSETLILCNTGTLPTPVEVQVAKISLPDKDHASTLEVECHSKELCAGEESAVCLTFPGGSTGGYHWRLQAIGVSSHAEVSVLALSGEPILSANVSRVSWGVCPAFLPDTREVTITNSGQYTATFTCLVLGDNHHQVALQPQEGELLPGDNQVISLTYIPMKGCILNGLLQIGYYDKIVDIAVDGESISESLELLGLEADEGSPRHFCSLPLIFVGCSTEAEFILLNSGTLMSRLSVQTHFPNSFTLVIPTATAESELILGAGERQRFLIRFAPDEKGNLQGDLSITTADGMKFEVLVRGQAESLGLEQLGGNLDFQMMAVGTSRSKELLFRSTSKLAFQVKIEKCLEPNVLLQFPTEVTMAIEGSGNEVPESINYLDIPPFRKVVLRIKGKAVESIELQGSIKIIAFSGEYPDVRPVEYPLPLQGHVSSSSILLNDISPIQFGVVPIGQSTVITRMISNVLGEPQVFSATVVLPSSLVTARSTACFSVEPTTQTLEGNASTELAITMSSTSMLLHNKEPAELLVKAEGFPKQAIKVPVLGEAGRAEIELLEPKGCMVSFGKVMVGHRREQQITLSNNGNIDATVTMRLLSKTPSVCYLATITAQEGTPNSMQETSMTVAPSSTMAMLVVFVPQEEGSWSTTLQLVQEGFGKEKKEWNVSISGTGGVQRLGPLPDELSILCSLVGETTLSFPIRNAGNDDVLVELDGRVEDDVWKGTVVAETARVTISPESSITSSLLIRVQPPLPESLTSSQAILSSLGERVTSAGMVELLGSVRILLKGQLVHQIVLHLQIRLDNLTVSPLTLEFGTVTRATRIIRSIQITNPNPFPVPVQIELPEHGPLLCDDTEAILAASTTREIDLTFFSEKPFSSLSNPMHVAIGSPLANLGVIEQPLTIPITVMTELDSLVPMSDPDCSFGIVPLHSMREKRIQLRNCQAHEVRFQIRWERKMSEKDSEYVAVDSIPGLTLLGTYQTLAPALQTIELTLRWEPETVGMINARLLFQVEEDNIPFSLTIRVIEAAISINVPVIDFGRVGVGSLVNATASIENTSPFPLALKCNSTQAHLLLRLEPKDERERYVKLMMGEVMHLHVSYYPIQVGSLQEHGTASEMLSVLAADPDDCRIADHLFEEQVWRSLIDIPVTGEAFLPRIEFQPSSALDLGSIPAFAPFQSRVLVVKNPTDTPFSLQWQTSEIAFEEGPEEDESTVKEVAALKVKSSCEITPHILNFKGGEAIQCSLKVISGQLGKGGGSAVLSCVATDLLPANDALHLWVTNRKEKLALPTWNISYHWTTLPMEQSAQVLYLLATESLSSRSWVECDEDKENDQWQTLLREEGPIILPLSSLQVTRVRSPSLYFAADERPERPPLIARPTPILPPNNNALKDTPTARIGRQHRESVLLARQRPLLPGANTSPWRAFGVDESSVSLAATTKVTQVELF